MIRIMQQNEPVDFEKKVREPGNHFLASCPTPRSKDWDGHAYWQRVSGEMYLLYQGICAYTGQWFSKTPTQTSARASIDHFRPKSESKYYHLAYEWSNYRLTTQKTNGYKKNLDDLADPFTIQHGWFVLRLPGCWIIPGDNVSSQERVMIEHTISTLKLNDDNDFVDLRYKIIKDYIDGCFDATNMQRKYPFIASELQRQNLLDIAKLKSVFKTLHRNTP